MQKLIRRLYEAEVWEDCRFLDINRFSGRNVQQEHVRKE